MTFRLKTLEALYAVCVSFKQRSGLQVMVGYFKGRLLWLVFKTVGVRVAAVFIIALTLAFFLGSKFESVRNFSILNLHFAKLFL